MGDFPVSRRQLFPRRFPGLSLRHPLPLVARGTQHTPLASRPPLRHEGRLSAQWRSRDDGLRQQRLEPEQFSALAHLYTSTKPERTPGGLAKPISGFTPSPMAATWLPWLLSWVVKDKCSNRLGLFLHSWAPLQTARVPFEHFYGQ